MFIDQRFLMSMLTHLQMDLISLLYIPRENKHGATREHLGR
jgi:hypothetical protein